MRKIIVGATLLACTVAAPAMAQESVVAPGKASVFSITPYIGHVFYGDFAEENVEGTSYTIDNSGIFGAEATLDFGRALSLVGNFGYSKSNFEFENDANGTETRTSNDLGIWLYDGSLRLKLPITMGMSSLAPYIQAGVGGMRFTVDNDNFNSGNASTNVAYNIATGATFKFMGFGLRGEVKDYISSLQFDTESNANEFSDFRNKDIAHNIAVSLGVTFAF